MKKHMHIHVPQEKCWAKLDDKTKKHLQSVETHSLLVGIAAKLILQRIINPFLEYKISEDIIVFIAFHDYGKIHVSFLCKNDYFLQMLRDEKFINDEEFKEIQKIIQVIINDKDERDENHHTVIGADLFREELLENTNISTGTKKRLSEILHLHHGYKRAEVLNEKPDDYCVDFSYTRKEFAKVIQDNFGHIEDFKEEYTPTIVWQLIRGLTILADWVASSITVEADGFSYKELEDLVEQRLKEYNLTNTYPSLKEDKTFQEALFPSNENVEMNNLQECVDNIKISEDEKGSVFIIEAGTGEGKSEASLWLTYKLLEKKLANGFYFALTTQATSNNIFKRINSFVENTYNNYSVRLMHGESFIRDEAIEFLKRLENRFYSNNKKSILYPFGLGTVDQILLSVINAKHADLRMLGLSNKVIIIDELHTYTIFTSILLKDMIKKLREIGCIIIILSATLTKRAKNELLDTNIDNDSYPLVTKVGKDNSLDYYPFKSRLNSKRIKINFFEKDYLESVPLILEKAKEGRVLIILNSVKRTQDLYKALLEQNKDSEVALLHSKFISRKRKQVENEWLEKFGKDSDDNNLCILVGTQVLEQSLDIDGCVLFTDLCIMDMLLQRLGRLWRFIRERMMKEPEVFIYTPGKISKDTWEDNKKEYKWNGIAGLIYDEYVLLKTYYAIHKRKYIDSIKEMRKLLERVYEIKSPKKWVEKYLVKKQNKEEVEKREAERQLINVDTPIDEDNLVISQCDGPPEKALKNDGEIECVFPKTRYIKQEVIKFVLAEKVISNEDRTKIIFKDGSETEIYKGCEKERHGMEVMKLLASNSVGIPVHSFTKGYEIKKDMKDKYHKTELEPFFGKMFFLAVVDENGRIRDIDGTDLECLFIYSEELGLLK